MSLFAWIVLGLIVGFFASRMVDRRGKGIFLDLILGIVGGLIGGYLFTWFSATPVHNLNIHSVLAAITGAVLVLFINYGIRWAFVDRLT
jgi:uncharacterized membrane protein YeaQ/YmgE (transglycosylase-associated protein family)